MINNRINVLRKTLFEKGIDGFLVSNFYNILYLTGFKTLTDNEREAWVLITAKNVYLFTDSRYINDKSFAFAKASTDKQMTNDNSTCLPAGKVTNNKFLILKLIAPEKGLIKHLKEIVSDEKIQKLGFEGEDLKYGEYLKLKERLGMELFSTDKLLVLQRAIKDEEEIGKIKKACEIVDRCLEEIVKTIKISSSEKEIAFKIEFWLKEKDYDLSFYPIVAIDKNSSVPHYDTRSGNNKKVKNNSLILIDFGAKYQDYCSDITRMIFVGELADEIVNAYNGLLDAQQKTIYQLKTDNNPASIDQFCRKLITDHQLPIYQHSTGHGVGLQIHEFPKISFTSTNVLQPNQIFTIEPGVYLEEKWGMRVEDTVLIKEGSEVEILTKFDKKLLVI